MKKKKWMYFVFISVIAALLMAAAWWIAAGAINPAMRTPSTDLSREAFHGMRIGDSIESKVFVRRFGKPIPRAQKDRKLVYYSWKGGLVTASKRPNRTRGGLPPFICLKCSACALAMCFQTHCLPCRHFLFAQVIRSKPIERFKSGTAKNR
ncbi:hypothetical protein NBRC111894_372 [Sporolactobacillus inulinus]|uniref:Uncharacterized protein n=1 Tax=Sporolactobacillus inulinus TaxID=2078 RepID=A0A4Y1Z7A6_9BACL|nr:hypothetical protein [Sporolactobacillus inulinus]GAY74818.1 hypothetical protein NBRC111894_372 [Sporolactobacillus inulinus]